MREQEFRIRDKKVRKMTKDGLVEENRTRGTTERISKREADAAFLKDEEEMPAQEPAEEEAAGAETDAGTGVSMRDAGDKPMKGKGPTIKADEGRKPKRRREGRTRRGREDTSPVRNRTAEPLPEGKRLSEGRGRGQPDEGGIVLREHRQSRLRDRTLPGRGSVREKEKSTGETDRCKAANSSF